MMQSLAAGRGLRCGGSRWPPQHPRLANSFSVPIGCILSLARSLSAGANTSLSVGIVSPDPVRISAQRVILFPRNPSCHVLGVEVMARFFPSCLSWLSRRWSGDWRRAAAPEPRVLRSRDPRLESANAHQSACQCPVYPNVKYLGAPGIKEGNNCSMTQLFCYALVQRLHLLWLSPRGRDHFSRDAQVRLACRLQKALLPATSYLSSLLEPLSVRTGVLDVFTSTSDDNLRPSGSN
jgi:hypothetical protein